MPTHTYLHIFYMYTSQKKKSHEGPEDDLDIEH